MTLRAALFCGLAAAPLLAQAGPGPLGDEGAHAVFQGAVLDQISAPYKLLSYSARSVALRQVSFDKSGAGGLKPGQWSACITVFGLASAYGGDDVDLGVAMGIYDRTVSPPTFTPNLLAKDLNSPGCSGLMVEPRDGLHAALDWVSGPRLANRADRSSAFHRPVAITAAAGTAALPLAWIDPAPAYVDGKLVLFYATGAAIAWRPVAETKDTAGVLVGAELTGDETVVWQPTAGRPHAPTPVVDAAGETQALLAAAQLKGDSDLWFVPGLTPADTPSPFLGDVRLAWLHNAGLAGGEVVFAEMTDEQRLGFRDVAWACGTRATINSKVTLRVGCRNTSANATIPGAIWLGPGVIPPFILPVMRGGFALQTPLVLLAGVTVQDADETADLSFTLPNDATLRGLRVAIQASFAPANELPVLTNTAWIAIAR